MINFSVSLNLFINKFFIFIPIFIVFADAF